MSYTNIDHSEWFAIQGYVLLVLPYLC